MIETDLSKDAQAFSLEAMVIAVTLKRLFFDSLSAVGRIPDCTSIIAQLTMSTSLEIARKQLLETT
jgi:predicted DNA-binding ribbon-helix-helix protein